MEVAQEGEEAAVAVGLAPRVAPVPAAEGIGGGDDVAGQELLGRVPEEVEQRGVLLVVGELGRGAPPGGGGGGGGVGGVGGARAGRGRVDELGAAPLANKEEEGGGPATLRGGRHRG